MKTMFLSHLLLQTFNSHTIPSPPFNPSPPLRQSTGLITKPSHLNDFVCSTATSYKSHIIPFDSLIPSHKALIAAHVDVVEPTFYHEAASDPNWVDVIAKEISVLEKTGTQEFAELPKGKKAIGCKWIYKVKKNADGSIERYKARLVAS